MNDEQRLAWRTLHVRRAPEEGALVTVNISGWTFSRHTRNGDVVIVTTPTYRVDTMRRADDFAADLLLEMDELAEVVAVLREYDDAVDAVVG